jgi:hypothetical protein
MRPGLVVISNTFSHPVLASSFRLSGNRIHGWMIEGGSADEEQNSCITFGSHFGDR